jgi:signal transduction histidine kinase
MNLPPDTAGEKAKKTFSPVYLAILSTVFLIILGINGFLEVNRTKKGFYSLLEREATVLIQHFEKNAKEAFTAIQEGENSRGTQLTSSFGAAFYGFEELAAEYLLDAAHQIDQMNEERPLSRSDLQTLAGQYGIGSVEIYDSEGGLVVEWPAGPGPRKEHSRTTSMFNVLIESSRPVWIDLSGKSIPSKGQGQWFSVAVRRRTSPGIVALYLDERQMKNLFRQFALQRAISDVGLREGILYLSVQDTSLITLAHTNQSLVGRREESPFLKNSLQSKQPPSRLFRGEKGEEIFEVAKPFNINGKPAGLIRVGFSASEISPILNQIKKNVALSILFFLILGVSAVTLIWVNRNRHLKRMELLENRVRLTERLSSLGHLAAGVAHEIRNPLNAIGMGLQRLRREFLPQELSQREEYLAFTKVIHKEVGRVNGIIEQFLSLSRPFELDLHDSSVQDLLKDLAVLFQEEASSKKIRIQTDCPSNLPPVRMDTEKLTQALVNIMKNAMEAMEKGGVLGIEARRYRDRVEITVADSGPGIGPGQMGKIFNYYYTTKEKGSGLGLPIAHRIVEAHGGQIRVESPAESGTRVTVVLPT